MSLRVRGLRKTFHNIRRSQEVLKGVDLDVGPGEVVGLIGPNGAGKTTLMSCLLAFLHPDEGEITIDGQATDDLDVRRRTGFVPERMNFDRRATGGEFLRYMARLAGVSDVQTRTRAMLERLYEDATSFGFPEERFERVYGEVETTLYRDTTQARVVAPLSGAWMAAERVDLGGGLALVRE